MEDDLYPILYSDIDEAQERPAGSALPSEISISDLVKQHSSGVGNIPIYEQPNRVSEDKMTISICMIGLTIQLLLLIIGLYGLYQ